MRPAQAHDLRRRPASTFLPLVHTEAVESKSRKDYLEMTRHWFEGQPEPEVFREAQNRIGAPGFRIRGSASCASAVYSGVFCLLALHNARDWRRGVDIRLQELNDHHIFPQAYLRRHDIIKRVDVNSIANRALISDETNSRIKDKAPASYIVDPTIFPVGAQPDLMEPHFIDEASISLIGAATETLTYQQAMDIYHRFIRAREAEMIEEIRRACGITAAAAGTNEDAVPDEVAEDVQAGAGTGMDEEEELETQVQFA
jgi:hypothetical protein